MKVSEVMRTLLSAQLAIWATVALALWARAAHAAPPEEPALATYTRAGAVERLCVRVWTKDTAADGIPMAWILATQPPAWIEHVPASVLQPGCERPRLLKTSQPEAADVALQR